MMRLGRLEFATRPSEFREGFRLLPAAMRELRHLPGLLADRMDLILLDLHRAHDEGEFGPMCWCAAHRERPVKWPCDEYKATVERRLTRTVHWR